MNVGKAIYYLLANNANVSAITTRIYPEIAPQDAAAPYIVYTISNVSPDDTHDGPATIDEVRMEITCVADTYDVAGDLASKVRVALDRVYGTYNTVNVESIQFQDVQIQVRDTPRQYGQELTFIVRVKRDDAQIATGSPIEDITLGRLADVDTAGVTDGQVISYNDATSTWVASDAAATLVDLTDTTIDDPIDRQVLAYDEATGKWINDGAGSISIPVFNETLEDIVPGRPLTATGSQGDRIAVSPFSNIYEELRFVGIAGETIPARSNGHATVYGEIRGLDTTNFEIGDFLYPVTNTNPTFYPYALSKWTDTIDNPLVCAIVTRKQQNTGRIFVRMWSPGYRNELRRMNDVQISTEFEGALLQYDSNLQKWAVPPQTSKLILEDATETVEIYYYSKTTDTQQYRDPQSDTPSAGNVIRRKIWYSVTAQDDIDSGTWILLQELDDDATYAQLVSAFESQLNTSPAGDTPVSIKTTWEDLPLPTTLLATYPGAAAGYSLRLIGDGDYAGSAIRVRRASDNTEQDIGFDGNGDLDTSALATFCAGTDGFVKTWYDQSGSGNDATQTTTSRQPKVYDSVTGVNLDNAKPANLFDGVTAGQGLFGTTISATAEAFSAVAVRNRTKVSVSDNYVFDSYIAPDRVNFDTLGPALSIGGQNFTPTFGGTGQTLISVFSSSAGTSGYTDGVDKNLTGGTHVDQRIGQFSIGNFVLAASQTGFGGNIQEIIIWPSDQSTNRTGIETNINDNYLIYGQSPTGLLADYPGAAAAYSLRQLISTAQLAIAVRRDSDDAVLGIGFVNGELDTTTLATFCSGANGFVAVWFDQSGSGNHATQATTSAQPKVYDSVTGVELDNTKAALTMSGSQFLRANASLTTEDVTLFTVYSADASKATQEIAGIGERDASKMRANIVLTDKHTTSIYNNNLLYNTNAGTQVLHTSVYDYPSTIEGAINGGTFNTKAVTMLQPSSPIIYVGESSTVSTATTMLGKAQEIIIYPSDQSDNRTGIETNINDYYSIYTL